MRQKNHSMNNDAQRAADVPLSRIELRGSPPLTGRRPWRKLRSGLLLGVGCLTSPCCTPLIVPLVLGALAGTPVAAFLAQYIGWVYATLTLISLVSLFLALRGFGLGRKLSS